MRTRVERPVYVTPHAVERFQEYLAPWDEQRIINWINSRLQRLPDEVDWRRPALLYGEVFELRPITVVVGPGEAEWPAVITVVGDQERLSRLRSWHGRTWCSKDSHRLRILRQFGYGPGDCAAILRQPLEAITKRWEGGTCTMVSQATPRAHA